MDTVLTDISVYWSDPNEIDNTYQPLDEFTSGSYPITMAFISSHDVFYPSLRNDPVFPAHTKAQLGPDYPGPDLYFNNSTRAGILGCVDQYQVCESTRGRCWDNSNISSLLDEPSLQSDSEERYAKRLMLIALEYSSAVGSIQFTGSEALDAQAKIAHMLSLPLAEQQWQVEAERMFRTSLARMQLNIFDFARGTASKYEGYIDTLAVEDRRMCQMVKVPTVGWRNLNLVGILGTSFGVGFVWVISLKREDDSKKKILVIVIIYRFMAKSAVCIWRNVLAPVAIHSGRMLWAGILVPSIRILKDWMGS